MAELPYRFTEAEMNRFRETLRDSPLRFVKCDHGHPIDAYSSRWRMGQIAVMYGVPLVTLECGERVCAACGVYEYAARCRLPGYIGVPQDPAQVVARGYPRHPSDAWRIGARALPRLDGVYRKPAARGEFVIGFETQDVEHCLLFTNGGEVYEFNVAYRHGLRSGSRFHEAVGVAVRGFDNSRPDNVRGLYTVAGNQLACHMLTPTDESYQYHATLKGPVNELKLQRTTIDGRRLDKHHFTFTQPG
ncbi:hypothetical protein [Streptomyces sp. TLI_171]|uniref:hypothetical protein n=1 Tax=Streptomyces sp. TLI_171 TaxID=1938859 RepID=UPI000C183964|nr:hypothetical protein [Streptomyces sp. TLI_171]RKE05083.1 hypothetical protein BX266_7337 [Streptomyces sp. TLI_171]